MGDNIRIERDPAFWRDLLAHPDVSHVMRGFDPGIALDAVIANPTVLPIASTNGGWWFVQMDPFGRVFDLHGAFTAEGRGREALSSLCEALSSIDFDACFVTELEDEPNSRPALTLGFRQTQEAYFDTAFGRARMWVLTREAWEASPVRRRIH